jgi:hypothetical protein
MLYSTVRGAVVMALVGSAVILTGFLTPGGAGFLLLPAVWLVSIEWGAAAASSLPLLWPLRRGHVGNPSVVPKD